MPSQLQPHNLEKIANLIREYFPQSSGKNMICDMAMRDEIEAKANHQTCAYPRLGLLLGIYNINFGLNDIMTDEKLENYDSYKDINDRRGFFMTGFQLMFGGLLLTPAAVLALTKINHDLTWQTQELERLKQNKLPKPNDITRIHEVKGEIKHSRIMQAISIIMLMAGTPMLGVGSYVMHLSKAADKEHSRNVENSILALDKQNALLDKYRHDRSNMSADEFHQAQLLKELVPIVEIMDDFVDDKIQEMQNQSRVAQR